MILGMLGVVVYLPVIPALGKQERIAPRSKLGLSYRPVRPW